MKNPPIQANCINRVGRNNLTCEVSLKNLATLVEKHITINAIADIKKPNKKKSAGVFIIMGLTGCDSNITERNATLKAHAETSAAKKPKLSSHTTIMPCERYYHQRMSQQFYQLISI